MKIESIYIPCQKWDVHLTRILVASIRQWYADIPILLLKDRLYGDFDTTDMAKNWGVSEFKVGRRGFGWGFIKLEPLFQQQRTRCLILDSDIVLAGPLLSTLEGCDSDFIVHEEDASPAFIKANYLDPDRLRTLDPDFAFPGFTFNSGQFVATTGILKPSDFEPYLDWTGEHGVLRQRDVFKLDGEQGLLNYVLLRKWLRHEMTLTRMPFMMAPEANPWVDANAHVRIDRRIRVELLNADSPYRCVVHWCGPKKPTLRAMPQHDVLLHFEAKFYERVPWGRFKRYGRAIARHAERHVRALVRRTPVRAWLRAGLRVWRGTS